MTKSGHLILTQQSMLFQLLNTETNTEIHKQAATEHSCSKGLTIYLKGRHKAFGVSIWCVQSVTPKDFHSSITNNLLIYQIGNRRMCIKMTVILNPLKSLELKLKTCTSASCLN